MNILSKSVFAWGGSIVKQIIFFLIICSISFAQKNRIRFENITTEKGLSQNSVTCICQDKKGFLWFGTIDGVNRYDGIEFKVFKNIPGDSNSISRSFIWAIIEDHNGNLWIGTDGGLNKYNREKETFTRFVAESKNKNKISSNRIRDLFEDKKGFIWIATEDGLNQYDVERNTFRIFKHNPQNKNSISNNSVRCIDEDENGNLWVGTDDGLNVYLRGADKFIHYLPSLSKVNCINDNVIYSIKNDEDVVWIGTLTGGLNKYNKKTRTFTSFKNDPKNPNSISSNFIRTIYKDKSGELWLGTFAGGLVKYDKKNNKFISYKVNPDEPTSISSNSIYKILEDKSGIIWIGTAYGGINKYDKWKNQFEFHSVKSKDKSFFSKNVTCFYEDPDDNGKYLWIGTWSGLVHYDREKESYKFYIHNEQDEFSISDNNVRAISKDKNGIIWVGTDNGLNRFNPQNGKFVRYFSSSKNSSSLSNNMVKSILVDHNGDVWIGTNSSIIDKYDPAHDCFIKYINDIPSSKNSKFNLIRILYENKKGNIYAGSDEGGVSILDRNKGKFIKYIDNDPNSQIRISSNRVLTLYENNYGLWIGTGGGGLNCYDKRNNKVIYFSRKEDLNSTSAHGITEDKEGNLWIITRNGISKINSTLEKIYNFDIQDGLINDEYHVNSILKSKTGEIFCGGIKGFNSFFPEKISHNKYVPPIVFTDIQLFNKTIPINKQINGRIILDKSISEEDEITLSYLDEVFSIEFLSLDFSTPGKYNYSYILEGYDKNWNEIGNRHYAYYTKVPPGEYKFIVKASNIFNSTASSFITLKINITPPIYGTWWFRILIVGILIGSIYAGFRIKTARIIRNNRELEKRVIERTYQLEHANKELEAFSYSVSHDLRAPLRAINGYSKIVIEEYENKLDDEGKRLLSIIKNNSLKMSELINDLLDFSRASRVEVKKQIVDMEKIVNTVVNELYEHSSRSRTEIKIYPIPKITGDPVLLKQVWHNLISNAIKFTSKVEKPEVEIGAIKNGEEIIFYVKDNGAGFDPKYSHKLFGVFQRLHNEAEFEGTGAGLAIIKRIIERHGGKIWAVGDVNKGATFYFTIQHKEV